ncbi:MAG: Gfo/Idh/MocA family oxidoreductase [Planctomycetes bacterium]|nr:Gfo/Idh/MocA family oxidoreductase [Planctomycetota bacterium]
MSAPNPTRRDFLQSSTTAALSAAAVAQLSLTAGVYAAGDDVIKVGLVGCGGRGTGAAGQALSTEGNVKLIAMGDAFADSLNGSLNNLKRGHADRVAVDDSHKFVGFDAYKQVIDSGVDLVILATPPGFRPTHFEYAVSKGKHVFMEKPVAVDAPGVRKVLEAVKVSKEKNLKVGVGLQRHHQDGYLETLKRIHDGAIGDVLAMRVYWNNPGVWEPRITHEQAKSEMEYQMKNWYYYLWLCGDHICEQHIHNLDVGNWVKQGHPVMARGMGGRQVRVDKRYGEIYDHFAVEYQYADGSWMFSQCRHQPNVWNSVSEYAHGTKGSSDVSGNSINAGGEKWSFRRDKSVKRSDPYQVEHDDLFRAIRNNTPYNEGENGANSSLTAVLGRMVVYSGKEVTWEEALNSNLDTMPKNLSWDADPPTKPNANFEYAIPTPGITKAV